MIYCACPGLVSCLSDISRTALTNFWRRLGYVVEVCTVRDPGPVNRSLTYERNSFEWICEFASKEEVLRAVRPAQPRSDEGARVRTYASPTEGW